MKAKYLILSAAFALVSLFSFGQTKTDTVKVWGNCESCKEHIEDAAKEAGATTAEWNKTTKLLVVSYDATKTTNMKIQAKIAEVGYDTQDIKGKDGAYQKLDKCCQYKRKEAAKPSSMNTNKKATNATCCTVKHTCNKDFCYKTDMSCCKTFTVKHNCYKNASSNCCA